MTNSAARTQHGGLAGVVGEDDLAGLEYWDQVWDETELPDPIDPRARGLRQHPRQQFHAWFSKYLTARGGRPMRVLEVGCARSVWLPYFAKEFDAEIVGLDYSELGCRQSEEVLRRHGVPGEIVCADLFAPPEHLLNAFDAVVTFGVIEHFEDTARCATALAAFLRPGGVALTVIPNNLGLLGTVQRLINRPVFDLHVLVDEPDLRAAHEAAGLEVVECDYFMSAHFAVANLNGVPSGAGRMLKQGVRGVLIAASAAIWQWERMTSRVQPSRTMSPYIVCAARRPGVSA